MSERSRRGAGGASPSPARGTQTSILRTPCLSGCPVRTHQRSVEPRRSRSLAGPFCHPPPPHHRAPLPGPRPESGSSCLGFGTGPGPNNILSWRSECRPSDAHKRLRRGSNTAAPQTQFKFFPPADKSLAEVPLRKRPIFTARHRRRALA